MERRTFLKQAMLIGAGVGTLACSDDSVEEADGRESAAADTIARVRRAMLAMQRYAWEQGVAAQALLELGDAETAILMARDAVLRRLPDGRLAVVSSNHGVTDPAANGEAVLYSARVTGDPELQRGAEGMRDYLLHQAPRTADGTLHHIDDKPQVWIDSVYMAPPFLAVAGEPEEAVRQIEGFRRLLWNPEKQLFSQIWDEGRGDFERADFWGVGNGWAAAGMARVIEALPPTMSGVSERLAGYVREVIDGCLAWQRPDGLFHDVVDRPETFVETNLSQMLAYTIYRGIQGGWLDAGYRRHADHMRQAAHGKVDESGLVRDVCGSPNFDSPGTATEGQAFFLLMEAAERDLRQAPA
jgi:unsaturated rhamnogalacturonyl hydrolase